MKTNKTKHTQKDLAEGIFISAKLTSAQKKQAAASLATARIKSKKTLPENTQISLELFQLKFQLEDYLENQDFDPAYSFGHFLKRYVDIIQVKRKIFAHDISIDETMLSQLINTHRMPPEYISIRLEIHSNYIIPAIYWYKLAEKQKEHDIITDQKLRKREEKNVLRVLSIAP